METNVKTNDVSVETINNPAVVAKTEVKKVKKAITKKSAVISSIKDLSIKQKQETVEKLLSNLYRIKTDNKYKTEMEKRFGKSQKQIQKDFRRNLRELGHTGGLRKSKYNKSININDLL